MIIGIDPGINGAICFFENGDVKGLIDMPLDDHDDNHLKFIKYGAKLAIKAMKACAKKGQQKRMELVDSMTSIGEIKFYLSNASGYGAVNYPNIIFRKKDES